MSEGLELARWCALVLRKFCSLEPTCGQGIFMSICEDRSESYFILTMVGIYACIILVISVMLGK